MVAPGEEITVVKASGRESLSRSNSTRIGIPVYRPRYNYVPFVERVVGGKRGSR